MSIKLKQLILSSVVFLMVGCASEPMIKLSEENQSIIEAKKQAKKGDGSASNETDANAEDSSESTPDNDSESIEEEARLTAFDTTQWQVMEEGVAAFTLDQFLPNVTYQIKQFGNGSKSRVDYVNFLDEASQSMQVESRIGDEVQLTFYQWDNSKIIQTGQETATNPYINQLSEVTRNPETDFVILQAPLQVGTSWQANGTTTSEITAIYQQATLGSLELENVIEVTSVAGNSQQQAYYAQGEGLVGLIETDGQGELTRVWQSQAIYHDNRIINEIEVMIPTKDEAMVESSTAAFKWQTNSDYASPFDSLLKDIGILDDTIKVNSVTLEGDVAIIDFTPGVVAVLNSYDAPEQAVIASIVTTVGNFFNTDQVRITVNGSGMLPDTIEYPINGVYQVSIVAQSLTSTTQSETQTESNNEDGSVKESSVDSSTASQSIEDESITDTNIQ
ncbi:GerMN domain-containing protein [Aerococcaceae bacterium WGS1372]